LCSRVACASASRDAAPQAWTAASAAALSSAAVERTLAASLAAEEAAAESEAASALHALLSSLCLGCMISGRRIRAHEIRAARRALLALPCWVLLRWTGLAPWVSGVKSEE